MNPLLAGTIDQMLWAFIGEQGNITIIHGYYFQWGQKVHFNDYFPTLGIVLLAIHGF